MASRAVLTERARQWAFEQVGFHDRAVARVAAQLGVAWHTIMTQVIERGAPLIGRPDPAGRRHRDRRRRRPAVLRRPPAPIRRCTPRGIARPHTRAAGATAGRAARPVPGGCCAAGLADRDAGMAGPRSSPPPWTRSGDAPPHSTCPASPRDPGAGPLSTIGQTRPDLRRRRPPPGPAGHPGAPRIHRRPAVPHPPACCATAPTGSPPGNAERARRGRSTRATRTARPPPTWLAQHLDGRTTPPPT